MKQSDGIYGLLDRQRAPARHWTMLALLETLAARLQRRRSLLLLTSIGTFLLAVLVLVPGSSIGGPWQVPVFSFIALVSASIWGVYLVALWFRPRLMESQNLLQRVLDPPLGTVSKYACTAFIILYFGVLLLSVILLLARFISRLT